MVFREEVRSGRPKSVPHLFRLRLIHANAGLPGRPEGRIRILRLTVGVEDGGKIVGLVPTHVDDLLLVADDQTRDMAGRVLEIRLNQSERRSPALTHCGCHASEDGETLKIDQNCYFPCMEPLGRKKKPSGRLI